MRKLLAIIASLGLLFGSFGYAEEPHKAPSPPISIKQMTDIKQTLIGLEKEISPGNLVRVKISPLTVQAGGNTITAIYKFALLEDGKISPNGETLTPTERSGDPVRTGPDFILSIPPNSTIKYQVIFAVTYIETKAGTTEVVGVSNIPIAVYDVKVAGYVPPPTPNNVPEGAFGFIRAVYQESIKLNVDKDKKIKLFTNLANTFSGLSSKIAAGIYKDDSDETKQINNVETFLKDTKVAVNDAIKDSGIEPKVLDGNIDVLIKGILEKLYNEGKMRKFADYQASWAEIAEGYRFALKN